MTIIKDFEEMPLPSGDADFADWLVPARNNIQRQLLRLQKLIGAPPPKKTRPKRYTPDPPEKWEIIGYLLGAAFSLWRAVFQSGENLEIRENFGAGQIFLDEIIRNNAAVYGTELNSWSLGYYLNNARFRLVDARRLLSRTTKIDSDLDSRVNDIEEALYKVEQDMSPKEWMDCLHVLRLMLDAIEAAPRR